MNCAGKFDGMVREEQEIFRGAQEKNIATQDEPVNKIETKYRERQRNSPRFTPQNSARFQNVICNRCGYKGHIASDPKCPAKGKQCNKCGGNNNFSRKCFSKRVDRVNNKLAEMKTDDEQPAFKKQKPNEEIVQLVHENPFDNDDDLNGVYCITTSGSDNEICCQIGGVQVKAIIDSGSKCNLIDEHTWQNMKKSNVKVTNKKRKSDRSFKAYGGHALTVLGTFDAALQIKNKQVTARFYIIKGKGKLLIGRETANALGILKIDIDVNKIDDSNQEFAKIKGVTVEIPIRSNVRPVVQPYRRVPIPVEKAVDDQIDTLLKVLLRR